MSKGLFLMEFKLLAAGVATIGLAGVGVGIGLIFSSLVDAYARNPHEMDKIFNYAILGFALCESIALFVLMIVFLILFAF